MSDIIESVTNWLAAHSAEMPSVLQQLVDIDSNSLDKIGTDAVGSVICGILQADNIGVSRLANAKYGDVLRLEVPGHEAGSHVLLLGHRDTVFKNGTVATRPFSRQNDIGFGPGVADMKGGLVVNIFALRAIKAVGGLRFPVVALFTADEEIGSPTGRAEI
jgi:glutamate carboxypeptidase